MAKNTGQDDKSKQLAELLQENISKSESKLNKARLHLMAMVIIALCKVQTVSFHKLAIAFDTKSKADSSLRRLQRFIASFHLCSDLTARLIFGLLPGKTNLKLVIDRTNWQFGKQNINTKFSLFDSNNIAFLPGDFQSNSHFGLHDLYAKSGYMWQMRKVKLGVNAEAHQLFNRFDSGDSKKTQNYFYLNPSVNFKWDITPTQNFSAFYNLRFQNTNFTQVNDSYLLSSSRSFHRGLGEFKLTDSQMANLNYSIRHFLNRYSFSLGLDYSTQSNVLSNRNTIEQNSSLSESIFIKGGETYGLNFRGNYYWRAIKSNLKLESRYSLSTSFNEVNNSGLRENQYATQFYSFDWRTRFKFPLNFHIGTEWTFSKVKSPDFSNSYTNGFSYLDLFYTVGENLDIKAVTEHYYFGSLEKNQRNHLFLDVEATYKFANGNNSISLRGNNLFNKQNFTTYVVSDIGYSQTSYRLMPRYVLIGFKSRFNF